MNAISKIPQKDEELKRLRFADITQMTDAGEVLDLVETLEVQAGQIEAQLEFMSEDQTDDWEGRAISALGIKRAMAGIARRHYHYLTKKTAPAERPVNQDAQAAREAKIKMKEIAAAANIELVRIDAERETARQNAAAIRIKAETIRAVLKAKHQNSHDRAFGEAAVKMLTREQVIECGRIASEVVAAQYDKLLADAEAA